MPSDRFPAPVYAETVLATNFEDAKKHFLTPLLEIHYAHTLMLAKQGIVTPAEARTLLAALDSLDREEIASATYDGTYEDLFFFIEDRLTKACGADIAGKMHTARSRNDIDICLYRMQVRRELLRIMTEIYQARGVLLELSVQHVETIMPAHTHTQPAQPTTLAHYLMAAVEFLGRDAERIQAAFRTVNRNPLGAGAITTTGFPIDREETARLLGFEGLQVNSYGAIAAIDYITESAAAIAVAMVNLGKLVQDLLVWCTQEFGFLRLGDAYVQASSIMPQKRNPVALEHTRILASRAVGEAQAILTCTHNTPFGDINDSEDDLLPLVFTMFSDAGRALRLFAGAVSKAEVNRQELRRRAGGSFLTVTELADTLVRREGLSFREAHHLVSATVKACGKNDTPADIVRTLLTLAPDLLGRQLTSRPEELIQALDPDHFVRIRGITGGPAPEAVDIEIARRHREQAELESWIVRKTESLESYRRQIRAEVNARLR